MRWTDYYEKINDWSVSTAVNKISSLEDMGAPDEIVDYFATGDPDRNLVPVH